MNNKILVLQIAWPQEEEAVVEIPILDQQNRKINICIIGLHILNPIDLWWEVVLEKEWLKVDLVSQELQWVYKTILKMLNKWYNNLKLKED